MLTHIAHYFILTILADYPGYEVIGHYILGYGTMLVVHGESASDYGSIT